MWDVLGAYGALAKSVVLPKRLDPDVMHEIQHHRVARDPVSGDPVVGNESNDRWRPAQR